MITVHQDQKFPACASKQEGPVLATIQLANSLVATEQGQNKCIIPVDCAFILKS